MPTVTLKDASPSTITANVKSSAVERAKALFMGEGQNIPPVNPNNISPEEMGAIKAPETRQSDSVEASAPEEAPKAPAEAEKPLSQEYAILARKEKQLRAQMQAFKAEQLAFEKAKQAAQQPATPPQPAFDPSKYIDRDALKKDPFAALAELGLDYEQLTNLALNAPKPEEVEFRRTVQELRDEIKALKGETENTKKTIQDQQSASYQQAVAQIRRETEQLVQQDDNFETIRETNSVSDVVDLIEKTFKEEQRLMTVEEAAKAVEDYLLDEAMKLTKLKKIQSRLAPAAQPAAVSPAKGAVDSKQQQSLKTLTNSVGSTRQLSARERAIAAMKGELK